MMRALSLAELTGPLQARLLGEDLVFSGVSTDSRTVQAGDLFVALVGEHHDGHHYLQQARASGAVAALVSAGEFDGLPLLKVADTAVALGLLGAFNRRLFQGPLAAITGSNGKTTAKNLASAVLSQRGKTLATRGNFNNEIGVPLTLLQLSPGIEFAVVEMGAARAGDIDWLCRLGQPRIALLLNAMAAHLEGFGSVDEVAVAKGEIFDRLGPDDTAVINADQPWAGDWRKRAGAATVLDFGLEKPALVSARAIETRGIAGSRFVLVTPAGETSVQLQLPGRHNVANALAAACVGLACDLSLDQISAGLASVAPVTGRLATCHTASGATVIDDCYNANPGSVRAAIDILAQSASRRTAILGAMKELGAASASLHRELGEYARDAGIERFWGVGEELRPAVDAFGPAGRFFPDQEALLAVLAAEITGNDTVLVKGSRGAAMEHIVQALLGTGEG